MSADVAVTHLPLWQRLWWRLEVRAAVVYLALRVVSAVLLNLAARDQEWFPGVTGPREDDIDLAMSWDAQWYQRIADDGYPAEIPVGPDGRAQQNPWAFYPLFPLSARWVGAATGLEFATVAPLLALLAGLGAAVLMARLLADTWAGALAGAGAGAGTGTLTDAERGPSRRRLRDGERVALAAVAVWAACPVAPALQFAYTESYSMLLLLAYLLLLVRERWWGAGMVALALGLTRPIALPLVIVVLAALALRWHARRIRPIGRREGAAMLGAAALTGGSGLLWTTLAWWGTGERDAYPRTMTAWRGVDEIQPFRPWLNAIEWAWTYHDRIWVLPALAMMAAALFVLVTLVPRVAPRIDVRLRVWCLAYTLYLLAVVDGTTSIFRYLLPLFPLAIVLVGAARGRVRPVALWSLTAFWVLVGIAGQIGWIRWLVLFSPPSDFPP
ncbi:hypothetical protein [Nocardioides sp. R-C-SC26]|uniref:hypothetical protein n=1 Tax=Nocardioides sp. R-C-SC26 TaxID=2870414 RepID=UPI001E357F54|nr:hypothetical protein [Nocardioides sp. R-C-SC26]